eukprot:1403081-Rhodomonas_salina.1
MLLPASTAARPRTTLTHLDSAPHSEHTNTLPLACRSARPHITRSLPKKRTQTQTRTRSHWHHQRPHVQTRQAITPIRIAL